LQVLKFMAMTQTGYGVSRAFTDATLKYCVESGGKNNLLPHSLNACEQVAEGLIDTLQGKRKTYVIDIPIPLEVRLLVSIFQLPFMCLSWPSLGQRTPSHFFPTFACSWWTPIKALSALNSKIL
jgi:hypothetical protein